MIIPSVAIVEDGAEPSGPGGVADVSKPHRLGGASSRTDLSLLISLHILGGGGENIKVMENVNGNLKCSAPWELGARGFRPSTATVPLSSCS